MNTQDLYMKKNLVTTQYNKIDLSGVELKVASFEKGNSAEYHLMCRPLKQEHFDQQVTKIMSSIEAYMTLKNMDLNKLVLLRFFVSDIANQMNTLESTISQIIYKHGVTAISIVQQAPVDGSKLCMWAYIVDDSSLVKSYVKHCLTVRWGGFDHLYHMQLLAASQSTSSYDQTLDVFERLDCDLSQKGLSMKENCIRTWIYVKDVDFNYHGVVVSRRAYFEKLGMVPQTHYIASTGIEGRHFNHHKNVLMDAYSIKGIRKEQVTFLQALEYLNPTHEYGVTFERGTSVDLQDRKHIYLSGTASIDDQGEVVYPQEIDQQIIRTLCNVKALLNDAGATMNDIVQLIIYLRDLADAKVVEEYFEINYVHIPKVIVLAPVCRPEWLIEMECIAIK